MKRFFLTLAVFLVGMLSFAQEESIFQQEGEANSPAIAHTASTRDNRGYAYVEQYTDPGAVVYHEGQFHMFRNGFVGWPAPVWIHYMVSDDGITWTQPSQEPILLTSDVPFAGLAALASSAIVEEDGTWVLYFYTWNPDASREIGRATASSPDGAWTIDPEPVLTVGEEGAWDSFSVGSPQVLKTETGYLMYYDGGAPATSDMRRIGLAFSEDGIHWEKYGENPILAPELEWEGTTVHQPRVVEIEEGYLMNYRTATGQRGGMSLGLAFSEDGITWERLSESSSLNVSMLSGFNGFFYTALEETDGTLYLFLELMPRSNVTDIYTFTADVQAILGN